MQLEGLKRAMKGHSFTHGETTCESHTLVPVRNLRCGGAQEGTDSSCSDQAGVPALGQWQSLHRFPMCQDTQHHREIPSQQGGVPCCTLICTESQDTWSASFGRTPPTLGGRHSAAFPASVCTAWLH